MQYNAHQPVSRKRVVAIARDLKGDFGPGFSLRDFTQATGIPEAIVAELFCHWDNVRRTIGLAPRRSPKPKRQLSDARIRELLLKHSRERNGRLPKWQFCKLIGITPHHLAYRFGSWYDLRESVGLPQQRFHRQVYSEDDITRDMQRVYQKIGRCPPYHLYKLAGGQISSATILARYRTWRAVRIRFELARREYHLALDPTWTPQKHEAELQRRRALGRAVRLATARRAKDAPPG